MYISKKVFEYHVTINKILNFIHTPLSFGHKGSKAFLHQYEKLEWKSVILTWKYKLFLQILFFLKKNLKDEIKKKKKNFFQ